MFFGGPAISGDQLEQCYVPHAVTCAKLNQSWCEWHTQTHVVLVGQELHGFACGTVIPYRCVILTLFHPSCALARIAPAPGRVLL